MASVVVWNSGWALQHIGHLNNVLAYKLTY